MSSNSPRFVRLGRDPLWNAAHPLAPGLTVAEAIRRFGLARLAASMKRCDVFVWHDSARTVYRSGVPGSMKEYLSPRGLIRPRCTGNRLIAVRSRTIEEALPHYRVEANGVAVG